MIQLEHHALVLRYSDLRIAAPGRQARLLDSLARHGQISPVMVIAVQARYILIDGYRRVDALKKLGADTVQAVDLDMDEDEALALQHRLARGRDRSPLEDAWLVHRLVEHGQTQEDVARALQRSPSWVSRHLALVRDLPGPVQEEVRQGRLCAHGAARYLVPLARANPEACVALVEHLPRGASSRELALLWRAFAAADPEVQARIVAEPTLFLRAAEVAPVNRDPPGASDGIPALARDLQMVSGICRRALRRTGSVGGESLDAWPEALRRSWLELQVAYRNLAAELTRRQSHARPG